MILLKYATCTSVDKQDEYRCWHVTYLFGLRVSKSLLRFDYLYLYQYAK